jgi:hypothetical protein
MYEIIQDGEEEGGFVNVDLFEDLDIRSNFGELHEKSLKQKIDVFREALEAGMCSVEFAVEQVFGDQLDDEGLMRLIIETKIQNEIPLTQSQEEYLEFIGGIDMSQDQTVE